MHEVLVNCLFKLAQEKVWLGELTVSPVMTIAVDLGRKATKQTKQNCHNTSEYIFSRDVIERYCTYGQILSSTLIEIPHICLS